jgi:uncharacterized protein with HEPN domain
MSRDEALLLDMLVAAREAIGFVAALDRAQFASSRLHQNAVARSIEVVGEAATKVSQNFRSTHPQIPWRDIVGMRNRLIHNYSNVSLDVLWDVCTAKLPGLVSLLLPLVPPDTGDRG